MISRKAPLVAAVLLASTQTAIANDLNINGFLSVGGSLLSNDDVSIPGYDTTGGFKQDTILGLQLSKSVNDSTSVTGQLVSRGAEDYKTEASWAYATYAATDNLDLRMGRLRLPLYYYSDFLEVGYAYDWVRPPLEVYNSQFNTVDGADLNYRFSFGSIDNSLQVYLGRYNRTGSGIDLPNLSGVVLTSSAGNMTYRASYHQAPEVEVTDNTAGIGAANTGSVAAILGVGGALNTALSANYTAAEIAEAADDFQIDGEAMSFYSFAAAYDNGDISLIGEVTQFSSEIAMFLDTTSYLVKAGKRFDDMTLHLTYSALETSTESGATGAAQELLLLENKENSITAGVRYDYDASTALKFEVQQHNEEKAVGIGENDESGLLISVALDLVF